MTRALELGRRRALWLIPIGVCVLLISPMAFTGRTFTPDWIDHVWLVWQQKLNFQDIGAPSYFIQTDELGAFYPVFAFYGANLYAVGGALALPLGAINAVIVLYFAAFLIAYCGWTWLSMQAGLSGLAAYLPGAIAVTAPYAITVAYGRGDFAETVATSMVPMVLASGVSICRADRLRAGPVAAFVFSIAILTGTHTLTLVWASTFLLGAAVIATLCWWEEIRSRSRRMLELGGLALLGLGVSMWFLVPLVAHNRDTLIGERGEPISQTEFTQIGQLLSPVRSSPQIPNGGADLHAQLPVLALVCAAILLAIAWPRLARARRWFAVGLTALLGVVVLLATTPSVIEDLPRVWRFTQFPYRLVTYGDLLVVGLLVLGLAGLRERPAARRVATVAVAAIAALGAVQAAAQAYAVPNWLTPTDRTTPHTRDVAFVAPYRTPPGWYAGPDFADASEPTAQPNLPRQLLVPVSASRRLTYELTYPPGAAGDVETNVTAGPYLVDVEGGDLVGTTSYQHMVLRLPASGGPRKVTFSARESVSLVAGQAISVLSLLGSLGLVAWLALRSRRDRDAAD